MTSLAGIYTRAAAENRAIVMSAMPASPGGTPVDGGCGDGRDCVQLGQHVGARVSLGLELAEQLVSARGSAGWTPARPT